MSGKYKSQREDSKKKKKENCNCNRCLPYVRLFLLPQALFFSGLQGFCGGAHEPPFSLPRIVKGKRRTKREKRICSWKSGSMIFDLAFPFYIPRLTGKYIMRSTILGQGTE